MPVFHPSDLVGKTFLMDPMEDGQRHDRARIVLAIEDHNGEIEDNPTRVVQFHCSINDGQSEEIITYNEILNHIENNETEETTIWKFKRITAHEGPLTRTHLSWKGSQYKNVMIEWENGEITSEPLAVIAADDPVPCALYAKENDLLELDAWKRFKPIVKRQQKLFRMVNQAKLRSYRTAPKYQYGFEVPKDYQHVIGLDEKAGNTKWQDSTKLEMAQLDEGRLVRYVQRLWTFGKATQWVQENSSASDICCQAQWATQEQSRCRWTPYRRSD
jgi:hypothetical protein